jgi:hypothetical protein
LSRSRKRSITGSGHEPSEPATKFRGGDPRLPRRSFLPLAASPGLKLVIRCLLGPNFPQGVGLAPAVQFLGRRTAIRPARFSGTTATATRSNRLRPSSRPSGPMHLIDARLATTE